MQNVDKRLEICKEDYRDVICAICFSMVTEACLVLEKKRFL